ncbi:MAG: hypothetical protein ACREKQ_15995 [Candidatus Rokuibacteriota bacterium]
MGRRAAAWGVPVAVLSVLALAGLYATTTPRYALYRLGMAMQQHDVATAERYFDAERIADAAADAIVAEHFSGQPPPATAAEVNGRRLAASIAKRRLRPEVLTRVRAEIHRSIERGGGQPGAVTLPVGLVAVLRSFEISRQGPEAWVAFQDEALGPIRFRMSRQPDRSWRISEFDPEWVRRQAREAPSRVR